MLKGTLQQKQRQTEIIMSIREEGFRKSKATGVIFIPKEEDYRFALSIIWERKLDGWELYKDEFQKYGIVTDPYFQDAVEKLLEAAA